MTNKPTIIVTVTPRPGLANAVRACLEHLEGHGIKIIILETDR